MAEIMEGARLGSVLKSEREGRQSRETVTVLAGDGADRALVLGQVCGRVTKGAASIAADDGNTGNGEPGDVELGALAQVGEYRLVCTTGGGAGTGKFQLAAPDGKLLPPLTVGEAYAGGHINLTLAAGGTAFAASDGFTVTVAAGSGKVKELAPAAIDGSQDAAGVMVGSYTAPDGVDAVGVAVVRDAVVAPSGLVWPDGITDDQKIAALAQLKARGIITRTEV